MLALPDVSLLCLDTRHPDLAFKAMQRCLDRARFREAVLLTRDGYGSPDPRITARAVPTLRNVAEYSHFMVKSLGPYFSGSHVLIMQWDSFIVDPQAWDAAFLDYDYIGAPWPHRSQPVGNGGFSLRSRRLIDALQDADLAWYQNDVDKGVAAILAGATAVRFDGSDLMPGEVGAGSFWKQMTAWVSGTTDLDSALKAIDASWPKK